MDERRNREGNDINRDKIRQNERRRIRQKKRRRQKIFRLSVIIILALVVGFIMFSAMKGLMSSSPEPELTGETVTVTIPEGSTTRDIADILKANDLIGSKLMFRISSRLNGFDGTYQQGTYEIDKGLDKIQIMELLQTGVVLDDLKFTVPEGYSVKEIAAKAESQGICTAEEFINASNNDEFNFAYMDELPERGYRLEGYLFPDTYYMDEDTTAHQLIQAMLTRFEGVYNETYQAAVAASGHTLDEIITIASMVEKEIVVDEERARCAGVIYNRLNEGMPLQIDATVLYAMGFVTENITTADLQIDSPYNTYAVNGLPEGPIANPGEASIAAAINPESHNYLYYVVEAKGQSNHVFCETYDEFLTAKANYQASGE